MSYWPWWAGAIALALITIGYTLSTDRTFGVSGAWDRVLHWREERELEELDAQFRDDGELEAALAAATAEEFGSGPVGPGPAGTAGGATSTGSRRPSAASASRPCSRS